jgi:class 3 adenylate cyclase
MSGDYDAKLKGSEVRLWELIEERTRAGADKARIDRRIWDLFGEEWAVMFTDLSGFSRQVATFGIIHFLQVIHEHKRLLLPIVAEHDGILVKIEADSFMIIFKRAESALGCAIAMQHACQKLSRGRPPEEQVLLCVGIGCGRILRIGDTDVYGQEVNAASKLGEDTAKSNEILVTHAVRERCGVMAGVTFSEHDEKVPGSDRNYRVGYPSV